ncbi:MAG TPA: glutamate-cysteine ligase family protein, partial [Thermopolyspora sp.]
MGKPVARGAFTGADRVRYRHKVRRCLDVFALMLDDFGFDADRPTTGLEIELSLIDAEAEPAMRNDEILANLADPAFQAELGQFNLELNARPRLIEGAGFADYEKDLLASLGRADERARKADARIILIGTLPTLTARHLVLDNLSTGERYRVLNAQIVAARGEDIGLDIRGVERVQLHSDSIAPEAACTSVQFHLQVAPDSFAEHWNAAQAIAAVQVALGANSPFLYGKQLWAETRIALFEQATDTRPDELKAQGVRPRVWFGERWITSIFDLFEENVRYFPALLPICDDEDPVEVLRNGGVPRLGELRLHNGTVYRWNRPVYDIMNGRPHLRV